MKNLPSVMKHNFSEVPKADIPRSSFNRSHGFKTTLEAGYLYPLFVDEVLPGDTHNLKLSTFGRLTTPLFPIMDNLFLDTFFFFVPNRLLWSNWKKFNGEQINPGDSTSFVVPTVTSTAGTGWAEASLADFMGIPTKIPGLVHSVLWHRAYNLIYNEWFRDENLQNSVAVNTGDGPDAAADYVLLRRGKRHDYFTSCLPWPQKGTAVTIPLGTSAPVLGIGAFNQTWSNTSPTVYESDLTTSVFAKYKDIQSDVANRSFYVEGNAAGTYPNIRADLSAATAATINSLRQAFQIQKLYERDARGGTRYTEIIRAHFGVTSPDARLQRPEYLGGSSNPVNFTPVPQTSVTAATPQGNVAAFATTSSNGSGFVKSFTEHGVLLGLVCLRADLNYQQGLDRMFSRSTRWDFYWPALSHIGEQAVLNKEIYAVGTSGGGLTQDAATFGYQERYAEYRYKPSRVAGAFRSNHSLTLDSWHLAQNFAALPTLGSTFIVENPPMNRILAVTGSAHMFLDTYFDYTCARPMPTYSVPGLIDHF